MGRWNDKYVIGLTGNIGMGKSLVRRMLEHLGAYTLDADGLTHQVMAPNAPAYQPIVEMFGKFVVNPDGQINRERLGSIAFAHGEALKELEKITHPIIRNAIDILVGNAKHKVVVVEAIKLVESDLGAMVDAIWVVDCKPELQLERLMKSRGMSELDARKRMSIQNPQNEKLSKAKVVIHNNGTPEETWAQVQTAWQQIGKGSEDQKQIQAPTTVSVQPPPAPAPAPTPAPSPAATSGELASFTVRRPMRPDFANIAALINHVTGSHLTDKDIISSFYEKTYIMAEANNLAIGIITFVVENLVTRVHDFVVSPTVPIEVVGKSLIEAMEKASNELQSEVAFVFLPQGQATQKGVFQTAGYEETPVDGVRYPAWREAVNEHKPENTDLLSRRLRENLVLKPI